MAEFEYISKQYATPAPSGPQPPADLSHHFSRVTKAREASSMKEFYKFFLIPGIGNLAGGLPNPSYFPYETLEAQIAQPDRWTPTPNDPNAVGASSTTTTKPSPASSSHMTVPHLSGIADPLRKIDLTTALQYGTAQGYPPLYSFLRQFAREVLHPNIPYAGGAEIILTNGSTDGLAKCLECMTNSWSPERDWIREREGILVEEFAYMNAVQNARPRGLQVVPVKIDLEGMLPEGPGGLEDVLANWDESKGKRPHLMYTVTMGQNPTSGVISIQRRRDLYAICSKYDVIIIEDDPYWYLQFPSAAVEEAAARNTAPPLPLNAGIETFAKKSGYPFIDSLVPSYLNVDTDGRVLRLDTFSKTVAPGCRLGWITGQPAIIERILRITETSTQQPSGFVQSVTAELVMGPQAHVPSRPKTKAEARAFTGWQMSGWVRWLEGLRGEYERRMNKMCSAFEAGRYQLKQQTPTRSLDNEWAVISKTKMYSFDWPRGGMFVWIQMHFETHPLWSAIDQNGPLIARSLWIFLASKPYLCLVTPGASFSPTEEIRIERGWQYFRTCFAAVDEDVLGTFAEAFAAGVAAFWKIKDRKDLDKIEPPASTADMEEAFADLSLGC